MNEELFSSFCECDVRPHLFEHTVVSLLSSSSSDNYNISPGSMSDHYLYLWCARKSDAASICVTLEVEGQRKIRKSRERDCD